MTPIAFHRGFTSWLPWLVTLCLASLSPVASAQTLTPTAANQADPIAAGSGVTESEPIERSDSSEGSGERPEEDPIYSSMTVVNPGLDSTRGTTRVTREDLQLRLPRSAPDALRYEAGVFVQQTSQAQGSAFIRGRTGQQTVMLFDGVRMNNSLYRQGPNQYFFTIDSRTIESIEVLRGSASTRFGSDAIAGVIAARPLEPTMDPAVTSVAVRPALMARYGSADQERGGRVQLDSQFGPRLAVLAGFGYRTTDELRSGGPVRNPTDGQIPQVPRFDDDGKTQLGTGFDEYTGDIRLVYSPNSDLRLTAAYYDYRQRDAPRTDQCPAPFAPFDDCLVYEEQDRQIALVTAEGRGGAAASAWRSTWSWQQQHERRAQNRPSLFSVNGGRDDVNTFGWTAQLRTNLFRASDNLRWLVRYGGDVYHDRVSSLAWLEFTDVDIIRIRSRGQYLDGSTYTWGGVFGEFELQPWRRWAFHAGGRLAVTAARADADIESGTLAVRNDWVSPVGNLSAEYWVNDAWTLTATLNQGFRAPNLDDLTSRQQTGPGFQIENAALAPERSLTSELGARLRDDRWTADVWLFHMLIRDGIVRAGRESSFCPTGTPQCNSSWSRFQLVNVEGNTTVHGAEGGLQWEPVTGLTLRGTAALAVGSSPNVEPRPLNPETPYDERVPLSRVPPLNGTTEIMYRHPAGVWVGAALRWATMQDRLAPSDLSDGRIPLGGTPGFATADLRVGYRNRKGFSLSAICENLTDAAYRYHGSSVNGAGRNVILNLEMWLP